MFILQPPYNFWNICFSTIIVSIPHKWDRLLLFLLFTYPLFITIFSLKPQSLRSPRIMYFQIFFGLPLSRILLAPSFTPCPLSTFLAPFQNPNYKNFFFNLLIFNPFIFNTSLHYSSLHSYSYVFSPT